MNSFTPPASDSTLSRREALIRLLRLGGAAAGTAGLGFWLTALGQRPEPELATNRETQPHCAP